MGKSNTSEEEKQRMIELANQGKSGKEIAKITGRAESTVSDITKEFRIKKKTFQRNAIPEFQLPEEIKNQLISEVSGQVLKLSRGLFRVEFALLGAILKKIKSGDYSLREAGYALAIVSDRIASLTGQSPQGVDPDNSDMSKQYEEEIKMQEIRTRVLGGEGTKELKSANIDEE